MNLLTKQELWARRTSSAQFPFPAKDFGFTDFRGCTLLLGPIRSQVYNGWGRLYFCDLKSTQHKVTAMGNQV